MAAVRWSVLFVGAVALIVGLVGLFVPVSVGGSQYSSEPAMDVGCGSAVFPDLAAAREATDLGGANIPIPDETGVDPNIATDGPADKVIANPDYVHLCEQGLDDRRLWTIPLAAIGGLAVLGAVLMAVQARRNRVAR